MSDIPGSTPADSGTQERPQAVAVVSRISSGGISLALPTTEDAPEGPAMSGTNPQPIDGQMEDNEEHLTWNLLQLSEPPVLNGPCSTAIVKWRIHSVGAKPEFRSRHFRCGEKNTCHLDDNIGPWTPGKLYPGILDVDARLQAGVRMSVNAGWTHHGWRIRQLVFNDRLTMCVEHRCPRASPHCFCPQHLERLGVGSTMARPASEVVEWPSIAKYVAAWAAAVELEAVACTIEDGDSRMIFGVDVLWGKGGAGSFEIPQATVATHGLKLRGLVRGSGGPAESASAWLCVRRCAGTAGLSPGWAGHGAVVGVSVQDLYGELVELEVDGGAAASCSPKAAVRVDFQLQPGVSDPMPWAGSRLRNCIVELLPKALTHTCMATGLAELAGSSRLTQEVVLQGRAPLEVCPAVEDLSAWRLNPSQGAALRAALEQPLSLIQGPPGTGKTRAAATLAVIFALRNLQESASSPVLYCAPSNDVADIACTRAGELALDHVALLRGARQRTGECPVCAYGALHNCPVCARPPGRSGGGLRMLRVYSAEIERADFPMPRRANHPSASPKMRLRTVPAELQASALHWRCHAAAPGVNASREATAAGLAYARLRQAACRGGGAVAALRARYLAALARARAAELRAAHVIFATCTSSRNAGLVAALRAEGAPEVRQVIVDEAGQVPEPETLCALTLSRAVQRIVLIGDPRQIRATVRSAAANQFGIGVSLLERLSKAPGARPQLLSLQYRMHPELNVFPSTYFYGGAVLTDASVAAREPGLLAHPGSPDWPAPLLFWDSVEVADEQMLQVRTTESNARSHYHANEAARAAWLAAALAGSNDGGGDPGGRARVRVAILTWYNAQVSQCIKLLDGASVHVGGVASAQGDEWDYVVLSTVRSVPGRLGRLADAHLFNVALTRARRGLCILGSIKALKTDVTWASLIRHCENGRLVTTKPPHVLR